MRGEVEVALLDLRDLAQRHVPGRLGVGRELAGILVHVDVGIDDPQRPRVSRGYRLVALQAHRVAPKDHMIGLYMAAKLEAAGTGAGSFNVHRGHAFEGFELRPEGVLAALCSCGATLDVAAARFRACPDCLGRALPLLAVPARARSWTTTRCSGGCPHSPEERHGDDAKRGGLRAA